MSACDPVQQAILQSFPLVAPLSPEAASASVIDGFLVGVGDSSFVIPLELVVECLELSAQQRRDASRRRLIELRGEVLPYASLRQIFAIDECASASASDSQSAIEAGGVSRSEIVVVVRSGRQRLGLAVDVLHGEIAATVKPLGHVFRHVHGIGGASILGTGEVALVVDLPELLSYLAAGTEQHQDAA